MPSKGVDYYSFIAIGETCVVFTGPKVGSTTGVVNNFSQNHLEIESSNLPGLEYTGVFVWNVFRNGLSLYSRSQDINSLTGNLGDGHLTPLMNTPAVIGADFTISYGFYDAGSGQGGLTHADQAWVSIVPNLTGWMGQMAPPNSAQEKQAFSLFVLAAAHDAGMNTMDGINLVTSGSRLAVIIAILSILIPIPGLAVLLAKSPQKIMLALAMTQKETTTSMLSMGVRYFDFRPAYLLPGVRSLVSSGDNTLYHTHLVIPGQRFDSFLNEIAAFLKAQPTELVVVRTCSDGIKQCEIPSPTVITQFAQNALSIHGIQVGDSSCFQRSIAELRASNTRLILVQENSKYDSYSDDAYAQLNPAKILERFNGMSTEGQAGNDFTVLQCQGTATGPTSVLVSAIAAANWSTSPLMSTKASFDIKTLPWVLSNTLSKLKAKQNIVIMNDFIDGATTYTAYELCINRFGQEQANIPPTPLPALNLLAPAKSTQDIVADVETLKAKEEAALVDERANVALLQNIIAAHRDAAVSAEDKQALVALEAVTREAKDVTSSQQKLTEVAEKRLQAAKDAAGQH